LQVDQTPNKGGLLTGHVAVVTGGVKRKKRNRFYPYQIEGEGWKKGGGLII